MLAQHQEMRGYRRAGERGDVNSKASFRVLPFIALAVLSLAGVWLVSKKQSIDTRARVQGETAELRGAHLRGTLLCILLLSNSRLDVLGERGRRCISGCTSQGFEQAEGRCSADDFSVKHVVVHQIHVAKLGNSELQAAMQTVCTLPSSVSLLIGMKSKRRRHLPISAT
jgi:hypothetical protein